MMAHKTGRRIVTHARFGLAGVLVVVLAVGCAGPRRMPFQAHRYRIDVRLEPAEHRLVGRTVIDLARPEELIVPSESGPVALEVELHPNLEVTDAKVSGATLLRHVSRPAPEEEDRPITPVIHEFVLEEPVDALTLFMEYEGRLVQDVAAGEKPGEIHNFVVQAHVGTEGIYLGGAHWYPSPVHDDGVAPRLAEFELTCNRIDGFELVASAESDPALAADTGRLGWRSPYPLDSVVLVGGPHEIHRTHHKGVEIRAHFKPDQADYAEGFLSAVKGYFDRYEPLVGPYPAKEYAVVDNFFSSGFAFPMFTLLFSDVIQMGRRAQTRHGMLDHEFLHSWWGNGVFVDPRDGNWCESITSYCTNYYGYVLDGKEDEARRKRRNYCHFLSSLKPEDDKPLGTFDQPDGCGRGIAYNKGAMVFHMLAQKIGEETLFAAMRRLTAEYTGRYASWEDIRRLCEEEAGQSLERFFYQWVREGGAPGLEVLSASFDSAEQTLTLTISQGESGFDLEVPVRVVHEDGMLDLTVPMSESVVEATFKVEVVPRTVIVDPDYHVFRKVGLGEIVPTTARTRYGSAFAAVIPEGDLPEQYAGVKEIFESSFEEDERITFVAGEVRRGELAERCLLILGDVVRDPYVDAYLRSINYPVTWSEKGFVFDGVEYMEPAHAILCTARHPGIEGGGITVIFANSEEAIPPARNIPFYDRSVVIFKDRMPILRKDLESPKEVPVEVN
jgi:aminopeptidase N